MERSCDATQVTCPGANKMLSRHIDTKCADGGPY